jgi:hypothetical protein
MMEPRRVETPSQKPGILVSRSEKRITALLWRFGTAPLDLDFTLDKTGFDPSRPVRLQRYLIDHEHGNFQHSSGRAELESVENRTLAVSSGRLSLKLSMPVNSVTLLVLEPDEPR